MDKVPNRNDSFEKIKIAQQRLNMERPLIGNVIIHYPLVDASNWLDSVSFNGECILFNSNFISNLSWHETEFVIVQSLLHFTYRNLLFKSHKAFLNTIFSKCKIRNQNYIKQIDYKDILLFPEPNLYDKSLDAFYKSCDYCINCELHDLDIGDMPEQALFDGQFRDLEFNDIFYTLMKKPQKRLKGTLLTHPFDLNKDKNPVNDCVQNLSCDTIIPKERLSEFKEILKFSDVQGQGTRAIGTPQHLDPAKIPKRLENIINDLDVEYKDYFSKIEQSTMPDTDAILNGNVLKYDSGKTYPIREQQMIAISCVERLKNLQDEYMSLKAEDTYKETTIEHLKNQFYVYLENFILFAKKNFSEEMFLRAIVQNLVRKNHIQPHPYKVSKEAFEGISDIINKVNVARHNHKEN